MRGGDNESRKPKLFAALGRAGLTQADMRREAGLSSSDLIMVFHKRAKPEIAGRVCRVLGGRLDLSATERREIFREVVNLPGRTDSLVSRVSSETPFDNLR